ncbi:MAG: IPT/TIG domain-containing protein, partial [Planctomycetota bacterium]
MMKSLRKLLPALLLVAAVSGASAQPVITGLNSSELPRSGRVAITGTGFGSSGDVVIAGLSAWTTTWTDTRVVAYVPEAAPVGAAPLYVIAGGEQSNEVALTVTLRQPDGRVRWRFETDGDNQWWRPAVAPNGTIYIHTNNA